MAEILLDGGGDDQGAHPVRAQNQQGPLDVVAAMAAVEEAGVGDAQQPRGHGRALGEDGGQLTESGLAGGGGVADAEENRWAARQTINSATATGHRGP